MFIFLHFSGNDKFTCSKRFLRYFVSSLFKFRNTKNTSVRGAVVLLLSVVELRGLRLPVLGLVRLAVRPIADGEEAPPRGARLAAQPVGRNKQAALTDARLHSHAALCGGLLPEAAGVAKGALVRTANAAAAASADEEVLAGGKEASDDLVLHLDIKLEALHPLEVARGQ